MGIKLCIKVDAKLALVKFEKHTQTGLYIINPFMYYFFLTT